MAARARQSPDSTLETTLFQQGVQPIAGLDEAGRGAWAGPVTAAAVILPVPGPALERKLAGLHDSKCLTARQREFWDQRIRQVARSLAVGCASAAEIDRLGILPATRLAMQRALYGLTERAEHLLIDYILVGDVGIDQTAIPHGDTTALSIAAASVVAKVARDQMLRDFDRAYPMYGFARHKGYGTSQHRDALDRLGPTPIHRHSFQPTQRALLAHQ